MTTFKGPEIIVENLSAEELFNKLSNLENLKEIIPKDVDEFEIENEKTCSFKMKNMPKLHLEISDKIPFSKITLSAKSNLQDFSLICFIQEKEHQSQARLEIDANINPMMKMMVEKLRAVFFFLRLIEVIGNHLKS